MHFVTVLHTARVVFVFYRQAAQNMRNASRLPVHCIQKPSGQVAALLTHPAAASFATHLTLTDGLLTILPDEPWACTSGGCWTSALPGPCLQVGGVVCNKVCRTSFMLLLYCCLMKEVVLLVLQQCSEMHGGVLGYLVCPA